MENFPLELVLISFLLGSIFFFTIGEHKEGNEYRELYRTYRTQADNRIGLLEHYLTMTCNNLGYQSFDYDKEKLNRIRAKCVQKFAGENNLPMNITWNGVQGIVYISRNQEFDINQLLMRPREATFDDR